MKNAGDLLDKYKAGTCTAEEKLLVETWMINLRAGQKSGLSESDFDESRRDIWQMVNQNRKHQKFTVNFWSAVSGAAVIMIILSAGLWFFKGEHPTEIKAQKINIPQDLQPGGDKAILTLSNGTRISLEDAANGEIDNQAGIRIIKNKEGQLIYKVAGESKVSDGVPVAFNTIQTPRGGQYQVILPDQSHVWLNAESSLRFPTVFGKERMVELRGEGYFEISHNESKPFKVITDGQIVQVIGTHFNVNSYSDEPSVKTTLIKGSVRVLGLSSDKSELLAPGEQSLLLKSGRLNKSAAVDVQEAVAWKNQLFYFNNSSIESVMRQLSRWYDVDVEYEGKIPQVRLSGEMHRRTQAGKVLEILSYFKIKYRIENAGSKGQKIIISQ